jgi:hypothetical protein
MLRAFSVVLLATACIAGAAHAQVVEVPRPYAIPLPPTAEPNWEIGGRYWWSEGSTRFDINSSKINPIFGNPTSTLTYDDINGNAGEFFWSVRNETDTFAKGFIGAGGLSGGSLDDEDFFVHQIKFSDTYSSVEGNSLIYGTIDVGQDFTLLDREAQVTLSPFVGFNYWQETVKVNGVRCNRDDVGGFFCGPPGSILVPFSSRVLKNEANWASLRLGGEFKVKFWDRLTFRGDAAVLPIAYLWNDDYHYLRSDLGRAPNIEDSGSGWGYQLEGELSLDVTQHWALGAGVRYWYAETNGDSDFIHLGVTSKLQDFTSERFGVFGNVTYRFATF